MDKSGKRRFRLEESQQQLEENQSIFASVFLRDGIGLPSDFLNAPNVCISCYIHVNLFSNFAPFLLGFESIKAKLLFVKNLSLKIKRELYTK